MTTTHNKLGPSKAHRWSVCPGSVREEARYPDAENDASISGSNTHLLLKMCIDAGISATAAIGTEIVSGIDDKFTVDKDRAARAQLCIDYVEERRKLYGPCTVSTEVAVDPTYLIGRKDLGGTADIVIEAQNVRVLEVIDYKDGFNGVQAEGNPQLELYALGVLSGLKLPINVPYPYDLVRMTIVQPKLAARNMAPVTGWEVPVSYLLGRLGRWAVAAAATDDPNAPLVPGESQCRFCKAKGACPALMEKTMTDVGMMFKPAVTEYKMDLVSPGPGVVIAAPIAASIVDVAAAKEPTTLDNAKIREVLEAAPLLRQFLDSVEEEALRRIKSGITIPGLKAVYGRGSRAWALPEDQMAEKLVRMGIPKGVIYETKLISPAKAEKVTWTKRDGTPKQLTERQLATMNNEYVTKSPGKLTVVSESDSRPAVELNAAPLFKAVEASIDVKIEAPPVLPAWLS